MQLTMRSRCLSWIPAVAAAVVGAACVAWWMARDPTVALVESVPGMDDPTGKRLSDRAAADRVLIGEHFAEFDGKPGDATYSWPELHGSRRDNICRQGVSLADAWPEAGPPVLWSIDLGEGHAAAAIHGGRVYLLDYMEKEHSDALRCFSLDDGREIWRRSYRVRVKRNHGMSRTVPAIAGGYAVTIGPRCHVMCVEAESGALKWGIDMVKEYGSEVPGWYTGQCPIIDDGLAILAPAGTNVLMMAVDCKSGNVVWRTPNPRQWKMSHASIRSMTVADKRMYIYAAVGAVAGVSADGDDRGDILWHASEWDPSVIAPSPVVLSDGRVFVTGGYGAGSAMFRIERKDGGFTAQLLYKVSPREGLACEQQTPVLYEDHLFGILPKDAGGLREQFACYRTDGTLVWSSGKTNRYGLGPFMVADGRILILDDDGMLTMIRASLEGYEPLATHQVLDGHDAWGPFAIVGTRLLLRDSKRMVCIDIGEGT